MIHGLASEVTRGETLNGCVGDAPRLDAYLKDVLHFKAAFFEPLDSHKFRQRNITDWLFALRFAVAERVRRQPEVALLKVPSTEALSVLSMFRHHPVGRENNKRLTRLSMESDEAGCCR